MSIFTLARELLKTFKDDAYLFGTGTLTRIGEVVSSIGISPVLILDNFTGSEKYKQVISDSLNASGVKLVGEVFGASPNAPREDLFRISRKLTEYDPDFIISFGGGSTIDAVKAAEVLRILSGEIDDYFGTGLVTQALFNSKKRLSPHVAIQTAASSAAHLTKYSNITNIATGQKKLIIDDAIIPTKSVFDYEVTYNAPMELTIDGAQDGIAHCLEVLYGSVGKPYYGKLKEVASIGIDLVVNHLPLVIDAPQNPQARDALCLATDLGGYAIMLGGTNGGHLTSFSLVDILSHGRACALMNPYYTVFFAPAIQEPLKLVGSIYKDAGFTSVDIDRLRGRELGVAVAEAMFEFANSIGFPICLSEIADFSDRHIIRALTAAKNPQLKMKLENMPVPLTIEMVDDYMSPVLEAAIDGNLSLIKNV